ncbi:MAG: hypothetical protein H3C54_02675 [Taibaiella sp.]|nr:hypothetical protein [Taibaiella sp.]
MKFKRVAIILFALLVLLLAVNKAYYTYYPNQLSIHPEMLSMINTETHRLKFMRKDTRLGQIILDRMYGKYDSIILPNDYPLSTPTSAEFTLPQFRYKCRPHILREHPGLRYNLWKHQSPDVILLGSSIFFCDFSRQEFYKRYPDKYLLDFTTGNNTPYIASWFVHYADSIGLQFKPGTIVLYGMNRVEMLEEYKSKTSHDHVKDAITKPQSKKTADQLIEEYLCLPQLRYDVTNALKNKYDELFRGGNMYRKAVDKRHLESEAEFIKYIQSAAVKSDKTNKFYPDRVTEIEHLASFLEQKGCKLVILKLPQSQYNDIILNTTGHSWFDEEATQFDHDNITYIDVSDMNSFGITQLDYIWPGNIFDPEHLNIEGSEKFTNALMKQVLDTMFTKQTTIH